MKKLFLSAILSSTMLVNAQIPNSGFEQWANKTLFGTTVNDPVGWHTLNYGMVSEGYQPAIIPTTDAYAGQTAMKIINVQNDYHAAGYATTMEWQGMDVVDKFPINLKPTKLRGFFKYLYTMKDTFSVVVMVYKDGVNVGYGALNSDTLVNTYTPFEVNIEYFMADTTIMPDSASISIVCSETKEDTTNLSVELYIDELSFDGIYASVDMEQKGNIKATLFPNPLADVVKIQFEQDTFGYSEVTVYDVLGNEVNALHKRSHTPVGPVELEWDTQTLQPGIYFVRIISYNSSKTIRVKMN